MTPTIPVPESRWLPAACCVASGGTTHAAASATGCSVTTVKRWRRHPKFIARVNQIRDDAMTAAVGRLTDSIVKAADTLAALLDSDSAPIRLKAAIALLNITPNFRADAELAHRLTTLEGITHEQIRT